MNLMPLILRTFPFIPSPEALFAPFVFIDWVVFEVVMGLMVGAR